MDTGARDSLADVISRSLTKLATQPEGKVTFKMNRQFQIPSSMMSTLLQEMALDDTLLA